MWRAALSSGDNHFINYSESTLGGCLPDADTYLSVFDDLECKSIVVLKDQTATDTNFLNHVDALLDRAKVEQPYYVGISHSAHGSHYKSLVEADGLGEGLCFYNLDEKDGEWSAGFLKDTVLRDRLNQFPAGGIVEVFIDTCYSGGMDRILKPHQKPRFIHNPGNHDKLLRLSNSTIGQGLNSNIIMWCACSEAQESADAYIDGGFHGAFTYYWAKAFRNNPWASRVEILLKTRALLTKNRYSQFPRLKAWNASAQRPVGK